MTNFAILGAGRIGKVHADSIASVRGANLASVADAMPQAAIALAEYHGASVADIDAIEADPGIDAVVICTPTDMHADQIETFVRAGKAVFCEKPIDLDIDRARQCLEIVAAHDGKLMLGFQRRFDPHFRALKAEIDAGRIGAVEMVALTSRDPGPPPYEYIERSGGIFRDMTIHDFDVARWLLNEDIETVYAAGSVLVDPEIGARGDFDSANVLLRTASGKQCTINNSRRASYGYDQRIEVHGSEGSVSAENMRAANIEVARKDGYTRPPVMDFFMSRYADAYAAEIAAFVAAISDGTPMPTTGQDGLEALLLAEAANRSARSGAVVAVKDVL